MGHPKTTFFIGEKLPKNDQKNDQKNLSKEKIK
jgi:hypothetical protein